MQGIGIGPASFSERIVVQVLLCSLSIGRTRCIIGLDHNRGRCGPRGRNHDVANIVGLLRVYERSYSIFVVGVDSVAGGGARLYQGRYRVVAVCNNL